MISSNKAKNPPAEYDVGEEVLIRMISKSSRLKSGGKRLLERKAEQAKVVEAKPEIERYKVLTEGGKTIWVSVKDVISVTRGETKRKRQGDVGNHPKKQSKKVKIAESATAGTVNVSVWVQECYCVNFINMGIIFVALLLYHCLF